MTENINSITQHPELARCEANFAPLSPVSYLARAAAIHGDRDAIVHGSRRISYREFYGRARQLADALQQLGVQAGDTVAILAANTPALLEAHYAVPMLGAVLNPINVRLDGAAIEFCLSHGKAKVFLADREFGAEISKALELHTSPLKVFDIADPETADMPALSDMEYEDLLKTGSQDFDYPGVTDEWDAICLLYTSGTTGNPKGGVYSHRGAYLAAMTNALVMKLDHQSRYLWTLPQFHCSGWTFTWAVTAVGGTHVCLRRVEPPKIFQLVRDQGITHMCGAPIVLNMLAHAPPSDRTEFEQTVLVATGGAAPPSSVIANMEALGFQVLHMYGTTESYGPATYCAPQDIWWQGDLQERHEKMAQQGIQHPCVEGMLVADPTTMQPVPKDGKTVGEIMLRGNTIMKGYLSNPEQTDASFAGGYYHSGDLATWDEEGYLAIKDRSKDIIISGGENISSLEIEEVLFRHPHIMEAAVVAAPDEKWGETPCAFITPTHDAVDKLTAEAVTEFCRENMAGFKIPRRIVFGPLPKTSTGKIQKFVLREQAKSI